MTCSHVDLMKYCSCALVTDQTYDSLSWRDPRLRLLILSSPGGGYQECCDHFAVCGKVSNNAQPQVDPGRNLKFFVIFCQLSMVLSLLFSQTSGFRDKRLDLGHHDAPLFATFCKNWELWKERRNYISEWILVEQVRAEQISQSPSDSWSQSFNLAPSIKSSLKIYHFPELNTTYKQ